MVGGHGVWMPVAHCCRSCVSVISRDLCCELYTFYILYILSDHIYLLKVNDTSYYVYTSISNPIWSLFIVTRACHIWLVTVDVMSITLTSTDHTLSNTIIINDQMCYLFHISYIDTNSSTDVVCSQHYIKCVWFSLWEAVLIGFVYLSMLSIHELACIVCNVNQLNYNYWC